jgi:carboxyl-terminal processing protease
MKGNISIMKKTILVLSLVSVGAFLGIFINTAVSGDNIYEQLKKFQYVYNVAYRNYVTEKTPEELNEAAIKGMLEGLDVHSVYIDKEEMEKVSENFSGEFEGIGIEFDMVDDTIIVVSPIKGGPSEELGIMAGDKIVKIDDEKAVGMKRSEVPKKLKGPKGTKVAVDIKREGQKKLIHFDIIRDKIPIETVDANYMIDDEIGYVTINRFAANTHAEMMKAVNELKQQGMKKLILDLRGNPGGYLTQAFYMADEFLKGGDTIVYTEGRRPEFNEMFASTEGGALKDIPLIVMVDAGSASASEIVSGAIQDLDRGLIVGETSYGKGLVQRQYDLGDGSAFRLTISYYYTPSGRSIQRPFEDKDEYRNLVGRLELDEGANLQHSLESLGKEKGDDKINMDSIPIFYTRKGRKVLGGGGITPDYIVKRDTTRLTETVVDMRMKRIFYDFTYEFLRSEEGTKFKAKYEKNFKDFYKNFEITEAMVNRAVEISKTKEIEVKEEDIEKDKDFLKVALKSTIAKIVWDSNKQMQVSSVLDRQLKKAKTLFNEAIKISSLN